MYFKTWKKGNIFSAHYKLHLRILTLILRLFSLIRKKKKKTRARDAHATHCQFCSWKRLLESLSLPMFTRYYKFRYFIRTIYISV